MDVQRPCLFVCGTFYICVFFVKQKPAYEMRISDWSSDVCSSDLPPGRRERQREQGRRDEHEQMERVDARDPPLPEGDHARVALAQPLAIGQPRSEARRVGKCVSTCRSRWAPYT